MPDNDFVRRGSMPKATAAPPPKRPSLSNQPPQTQTQPSTSKAAKQNAPDGSKTQNTDPNAAQQTPKTVPRKRMRPPQPIEVLLGDYLVNASGDKVSPTRFVVEGGVLGLYFGAKWCPPCKKLFPNLMLLYEEMTMSEDHAFEMVYISFDNTAKSFEENMKLMPWWAVDYEDFDKRESIATTFNVSGIPLLLLLDVNTMELITREGIAFVKVDPRGAQFPWRDLKTPHPSPPPATAIAEALALLASVVELIPSDSRTQNIRNGSTSERGGSVSDGGKRTKERE